MERGCTAACTPAQRRSDWCAGIEARCIHCRVPTLLIASAADRLLPSMGEAARLAALLPDARRVTLPDSGHTVDTLCF